MVLKTNQDSCYFYDSDTNTQSRKFIESPNLSLIFIDNEERKELDNVYLDPRTNVIVGRDVNGTTYVIDDGYRNSMIRAGYLVYKNYDELKINDRNEGAKIHDELVYLVSQAIKKAFPTIERNVIGFSENYTLIDDGYRFTIGIYSNIDIVKKNQERKINGLQFYPFDKRMDNYGTLYITIHCQRIEENNENKSTVIADNILKSIIDNTEDIKFTIMDISNPLYYTKSGGDL